MVPETIIQRDDVTLVPLLPSHVTESYVSWLNNPEVTAQTEIPSGAWTFDSARHYVESAAAASDAQMWAIHFKGYGHVGNVRLSAINIPHQRAAMAILIGEKAVWGRGISSNAISLVSSHAFDRLNLHKVSAGIYETNIASRRAFEKAGFHLEATLKEHAYHEGRFIDIWQMANFK